MYWIGTTCVYAASMAEMFKMLGHPLAAYTNMVDNKKEMAKDGSIPEDMLETMHEQYTPVTGEISIKNVTKTLIFILISVFKKLLFAKKYLRYTKITKLNNITKPFTTKMCIVKSRIVNKHQAFLVSKGSSCNARHNKQQRAVLYRTALCCLFGLAAANAAFS